MKTKYLLLSLILCGSAVPMSSFARLGETVEESIARYGKPVLESNGGREKFPFKEWRIREVGSQIVEEFHDGICISISYSFPRIKKEEVISSVLDSEGGIQSWKQTGKLDWIRDDGATLYCSGAFRFQSANYQELRNLAHQEHIKQIESRL